MTKNSMSRTCRSLSPTINSGVCNYERAFSTSWPARRWSAVRSSSFGGSSRSNPFALTSHHREATTIESDQDDATHFSGERVAWTNRLQEFIDLCIVLTMRSTEGIARSSSASAAGKGMCGVVIRTIGPSRS